MRIKTLLIALCMSMPVFVQAQVKLSKDFTIKVSQPYGVVDARNKEYFGDGAGHIVTVKNDDELVTIQRFNVSDGKELSKKEFKDFPKNTELQKTIQVGNKVFFIYTVPKKGDLFEVYSREVDMAQGAFLAPKLIFTTKGDISRTKPLETIGVWGPMRGPFLSIYNSFDDSKIMIMYRRIPLKRSDALNKDILGFYVFDNTMKNLWGDEYTMPHTEKEMNNLAYCVTKDGAAHMLSYLNEAKAFELININGAAPVVNKTLELDGKLLFQNFNVKEDAEGNLVCVGYYARGIEAKINWAGGANLSWNIDGLKVFRIDPAGKMLNNKDYEFPIELLNAFESAKQQEKNKKRDGEGKAGIPDLQLRQVVSNDDGSMTIIGEQYYIRNEFYINTTRLIYYYGDMIVSRIGKDGNIMWMKKLPKNQAGLTGKGGNGIRVINQKSHTYFLYTDNKKNAELKEGTAPEKHMDGRGGFLTAYKLDNATGSFERHLLFDMDDLNGEEIFQFNTSRIFEPETNVFCLESYMKKKVDKMIRMELVTK